MNHHKTVLQPNSLEMLKYLESLVHKSVYDTVCKLILEEDWEFYIVRQNCGKAYSLRKHITLPTFALNPKLEVTKPGYATWYTAHECAHAFAFKEKHFEHGLPFMQALKVICPKDFWHYETSYKPRNAASAGISATKGNEILKLGRKAYDIDMGDLL